MKGLFRPPLPPLTPATLVLHPPSEPVGGEPLFVTSFLCLAVSWAHIDRPKCTLQLKNISHVIPSSKTEEQDPSPSSTSSPSIWDVLTDSSRTSSGMPSGVVILRSDSTLTLPRVYVCARECEPLHQV